MNIPAKFQMYLIPSLSFLPIGISFTSSLVQSADLGANGRYCQKQNVTFELGELISDVIKHDNLCSDHHNNVTT